MTIMNIGKAISYLRDGKLEELREYITNVENINKSNQSGENLLHLAVMYCQDNKGEKNPTITAKQIFELLIEKGVSVQQENYQGDTPLTIARKGMNISNKEEIIEILEEANRKVANSKAAEQAAAQVAAAYQEAEVALDNAARTFKQKSGVVTLQNKIEAVSNAIVKLHKVNTTEWQLQIIGQEEDKMCVSSLSQAQQAELKAQHVEQKVVEDVKKDDLTDIKLSLELEKALGRLKKAPCAEGLTSEVTKVLAAAKAEAQQKAAAKQAAEARSTAREKEAADQAAAQTQKLRTPPPRPSIRQPSMKKNQAANSDANSIVGRGSAPKPQPHRFAEEENPKDAAPKVTIAARVAAQRSAARSAPLLVAGRGEGSVDRPPLQAPTGKSHSFAEGKSLEKTGPKVTIAARVVAKPSVEAKAAAEATETSNKNAREDRGAGSLDRPPPTAKSNENEREDRVAGSAAEKKDQTQYHQPVYATARAIDRAALNNASAPASGTAGASTGCYTPFVERVSSSCTSGARGFATFVERTSLACASSAGNCISFVERVGAACDSCISALESL